MVLSPEFELALALANNPWWGEVTLPPWFTSYRPQQISAINQVLEAFNEVDLVVLDAPTGSGKSLIADTVRQLLHLSSVYICTTKTLQDQLAAAFPYGSVLKGRSNYATNLYPEKFNLKWDGLSCADCTKVPGDDNSCQWCESVRECGYERAKRAALASPLPIINTSYFLTECNGPGRFSGRGLVILDEADSVERELMGYVEVAISEKRIKKYGLPIPKVTVETSWAEWVEMVIPLVEAEIRKAEQRPPNDLQNIRENKYLSNLRGKLRWLSEGLVAGTWIYTGNTKEVSFKPVMVDKLGDQFLWKHGGKWLVMSGTVISSQEMLESLGWRKGYKTITLPSTFPKENRKVIVRPVADMSKKGRENPDEIRRMLESVASIVSSRPESILIHTVSYDLAKTIENSLRSHGRVCITYSSSSERESAISKFKRTEGSIIIAPSLDRGIDLPADLCRVQIICKIPFGYLGDKQVAKRKFGTRNGEVWYVVNAIRTLVQMCGRGVRSEDDYCVTYLLDKGFAGLYANWRRVFPEWWKEGLVWER